MKIIKEKKPASPETIDLVKRAMEARGLNIQKLAHKCGLSQYPIYQLFKNGALSKKTAEAIRRVLKIKV